MARSDGAFDPKTEQLALGMARGLSVREAAEKVPMAYRTAQRRSADPRFSARVAELRGGLIGEARNKLVGAIDSATNKLLELLDNADAAIQLRSADKLIGHALRLDDHADLVSRLGRLEELLEKRERERA